MCNVPASLKELIIYICDKLESIFSKQQQGMSELVQGSSCIDSITRTAVSELSSSSMNHFCPCLEYLYLRECGNLRAVLNLPPSLKTIIISGCRSIQVLSCQLDGPPRPPVSASINALEPSAETRENSLPPYLTYLEIYSCDMLGGILRLPTSLTHLIIRNNNGFTSLQSLAGEPPSLEVLELEGCSTLASLPNEPHAYRSLKRLYITDCHALKKLPRCLQQQLGSIQSKELDAQYEGTHVFLSLFAISHQQMQAYIPCTTSIRHLPFALSLRCLKSGSSNLTAMLHDYWYYHICYSVKHWYIRKF
jgi:hypothetical protein